jgi:hypothetical protein
MAFARSFRRGRTPTGTDYLYYTATNGHGNFATGTVYMTIYSSTESPLNVVFGSGLDNGDLAVRFAGKPNALRIPNSCNSIKTIEKL